MKSLLSLIALVFLLSCSQKSLSDKEILEYTAKGKEIGKFTMKNLGGNLMKQMKEGGTVKAIPFCNISANPLVKEVAEKYNVSIKRTSHKLRNENNKATNDEAIILKQYVEAISNKKKLTPVVSRDKNGKVHFYAPIKLEKKCLTCHGVIGNEINSKTDSILKKYYPNDKATGFKVGDLRGMLSVTFNE